MTDNKNYNVDCKQEEEEVEKVTLRKQIKLLQKQIISKSENIKKKFWKRLIENQMTREKQDQKLRMKKQN